MKKFFLTAIILMPTLLLAENGVTISGLSVGVGSLTFTVSWDKPAPASTLTWSDTVWVFVDYNNAGVMKRLSLATGATLTATSAPGIGKVIPVSGNTQGVWVVGNARTTSSFSATVVLPFSGSNVSGACAYASNYPPFGDWNSEGTQLTLTGTAPYTLHLEGPLANDPVILNNVYTLPDGYTLASFTDATGAPGMLHCTPPTAPESLTPSFATVCSGVSVLLTAAGGQEGSNSQFEFGTGSVGTGGTLTSLNTYSVTPTSSTTYWVRRASTDGCGVTAAATVAVAVTPAFTQGDPAAATICYNTTNTFNLSIPSGGSGDVTYLWEQSSNNSDWTTATGTNNAQNYTTSQLTTNTYYRRKAAAATCGGTITTTSALVTVNGNFTQSDPATATICYNTTNAFTVAVPTGGSGVITYLWEQSSDNSSWTAATGTNNTQNYTTPPLTTNTYYRRKAAAATCGGTITSNSALVTVNGSFTQGDPSVATICYNTTNTFNLAAPSGGSGAVTYLWEQSPNGADNWTTATGTSNAQNYTTPSLTTNTYYRRKAAAVTCGGTITTSGALVTVTPTNTVTLYSGSTNTSATQTVAMTSIVYNSTGATGFTATGLPGGVTASSSTNKITISGTPSATGTFNYSATLTGGCGVVATSGKITVAAPPVTTPPSAKSSSTWSINSQTWSDVINISACNKTTYSASNTTADCRNNGSYGYLYSWVYVVNNASSLCPSPWRVPTKNDFCQAVNGSSSSCGNKSVNLTSSNGWTFGGYCGADGTRSTQDTYGACWSSSEDSSTKGIDLNFGSSLAVTNRADDKSIGFMVRCVK